MNDFFALALDTDGNTIWNYFGGYTQDDKSVHIKVNNQGEVYLCTTRSWGTSTKMVKLEKLNALGNFIWMKSFGGSPATITPYAFDLDEESNMYIGGSFFDEVDFDPAGSNIHVYDGINQGDLYLLKLDSAANFSWVKVLSGPGFSFLTSLNVSDDNFLYATGEFTDVLDFDPTPAIDLDSTNGSFNSFLIKTDIDGNFLWKGIFKSSDDSSIGEVSIGENNELYIFGDFQNDVIADPGTDEDTLYGNGVYDCFLTSFLQDPCMNFSLILDSLSDVTCATDGIGLTHAVYSSTPVEYVWNTMQPTLDSVAYFDTAGVFQITATNDSACYSERTVIIDGPGFSSGYDFNVNFVSNSMRPGFDSRIWLDAFNDGCQLDSGDVSIILPDSVIFLQSDPLPDLIQGDTLIWSVQNMIYDSSHFTPVIDINVSQYMQIGDSLCFDVSFLPSLNDMDTTNNKKRYCKPIINGYDPNAKYVYPIGDCSEKLVPKDEVLTYTLRFQNTGNAEAINIYLLDTISPFLDINSIRVLGQSHENLKTTILPDNVVKFQFDSILLPDSTNYEPMSHGYVIFEIEQQPWLPNQTLIENKVEIYFDYNPPVVTNKTSSKVQDCDSLGVSPIFLDLIICQNDSIQGWVLPDQSCYSLEWFVNDTLASAADNLKWKPTFTGNHEVRIVKRNNICSTDSTVVIEVLSSPIVTLSEFTQDSICKQDNLLILPEGVPENGTYNGLGVVNDSLIDPNQLNLGINVIYYEYIAQNGCSEVDSVTLFVDDCASLNTEVIESVKIYPNPNNGTFYLKSYDDFSAITEIRITDIKGRLIKKYNGENLNSKLFKLDIDKGLYYFSIIHQRHVKTITLIIR
jgi:uncharacterized repeat protein (TIGR01451 family)